MSTLLTKRKTYCTKYEGRRSMTRKQKFKRICLDCNVKFVAEGRYNRLCNICNRQYRSVLWAS